MSDAQRYDAIDCRHRERLRQLARGELTFEQAQAESDADWEPLTGPSDRQVVERLAAWIEVNVEGARVDRTAGAVVKAES